MSEIEKEKEMKKAQALAEIDVLRRMVEIEYVKGVMESMDRLINILFGRKEYLSELPDSLVWLYKEGKKIESDTEFGG